MVREDERNTAGEELGEIGEVTFLCGTIGFQETRLLERLERKASLVMWFGWILTTWMVLGASHLTITIP